MRYLSDDGKVFNTKEECDEYEAALKEHDRLKEEEAELKKRNDELKKLSDKYEIILKELEGLGSEIDRYKKKYSSKDTKKTKETKKTYDEDDLAESFADLLMNYFN